MKHFQVFCQLLIVKASALLGNISAISPQKLLRLLPSYADALKISELTKDLKKFHSISLLLQKRDGVVNLADVQSLFDKQIADFGDDFKLYLFLR